MISNKPYIVRAMYDWIVDNEWTPHLQVDAHYPSVDVPAQYVQDGIIVLNIDPVAVMALSMDNDWFALSARFGGIETQLGFPPEAILAIFAQENGQGMPFQAEPYPSEEALKAEQAIAEARDKKPTLTAVKAEASSAEASATLSSSSAKKTSAKKKPTLSIVK
ncbi:MAG: ClpXP protease specificity-enhancing factor [Gammaproteobacteria bacterium]|nr:ClpXP protease specificity-enhancing factor [Gammaproteobacteria bacterium]